MEMEFQFGKMKEALEMKSANSANMYTGGASGKEMLEMGFDPWVGKIPWRRAWQPTPVFLPGETHGQRSLARYSPWDCEEPDMTEAI